MPSLAKHQSNDYIKLLLLGDAKSGKTGSLVSLVKAGYKLRVLDMDNLLDVLKYFVMEQCPEKLENIEFRTLRDKYKTSPMGTIIDGQPKAWFESIKMLNHWKYKDGDDEIDLGKPGDWGPECILVIDSLSRWCDAAYNLHYAVAPSGQDGRAIFFDAQKDVEKQLATITSDTFECNVIVICHGTFIDMQDGTKKIFPQGVGQALSPKIPQYFPNYIRYKNVNGKRMIQTVSDPMIDLANARPSLIKGTFDINTGLAEIFAALRSPPAQEEQATNKPIQPNAMIIKKRA